MTPKPLIWVGTSLADVRAFGAEARRFVGRQLYRVQLGLMPSDWKSMPSVGPGVYELRVHTSVGHRDFYVSKYDEAIYILHAFEKRSRKTRQSDLVLARARLRRVQEARRAERKVRPD